ncbi:MAG: beta-ketoacyl synthase N-terminal-like domain-containing protein [Phycisphaerae bacterium]
MTDTVYMYALVGQSGTKPVYCARNMSADARPPDDREDSNLSGREINAITTQSHKLTSVLLQGVSAAQRETMGLFIGTRYGSLEDDRIFQASRVADGGRFASPAAFRRTLPSTVPAELTIAFGLRGPLITFADRQTPGMLAIIRAAKWIAGGRMNAAIAGSLDFITPAHADSPDSSSVCRTLLCLLATRDTFSELRPWAKIMLAEISANCGTSRQAAAQSEASDFPAIVQLTSMSRLSTQRIDQDGGNGHLCRLQIQVL